MKRIVQLDNGSIAVRATAKAKNRHGAVARNSRTNA
jgi:hypothetical protein